MKNLFTLVTVIFLLQNISLGQQFDWATMAGGEGSDQAYAIATDNNGNSYVTGWFSESAHFGDIILTSEGGKDVFVAKYNNDGEVIWAKRAWGIASNSAAGITLDWDGFPIITGWFAESIHFEDIVLESQGSYDMFVARYNSEGDVIWAKSAGGEGDDYGNRLTTNIEHDVLVAGSFRYTAYFGEETSISSEGDRDIFIANYANTGDFQWVKEAGGGGEDRAYDIISNDEGSTYFTGVFNGKAFFGEYDVMSGAFLSTYICKMDAGGNFLWVRKGSGGANDFARGFGIAMDGEGYIYGNGTFSGKLTFSEQTVEATGGEFDFDTYLVKYKNDGELMWLKNAGGYGMDQAMDIFTDIDGNSFVTGFFSDRAEFDDLVLESQGKADVFVAQYNWAGEVQWVKQAGGNYLDYSYGISHGDPENHFLFICGNFQEEASFDTHELTVWGQEDMYVAKLNYSGDFIGEPGTATVLVFPNPNAGSFDIEVGEQSQAFTVKIFSVDGKQLRQYNFNGARGSIRIETDLSGGIYKLSIPELNLSSKVIVK